MSVLPVVGGSNNTWGTILNTYLNGIMATDLWVTGLVNDSGVTDNTATLAAFELQAHNSGASVIHLPSSANGAFGCNFATTYHGITWVGMGMNNPSTGSSAACTTLCGLNSAIGTQVAVFDIETNDTTLKDLDINAGTVAKDSIGATNWLASMALLDNGVDTRLSNVSPRNGSVVALQQTSTSKRAKYTEIRPSQPIGSSDATYYARRTFVGSVVAGGFQVTITDGTHTFTAPSNAGTPWTSISSVGNQISGAGVTPGTYILTVNSTTNATVSQKCKVGTSITFTEYQSDCIWLNGSDTEINTSVMNFGTKRYQGSGQGSNIHNTFTGTSGCNNVIFEGGSTYRFGEFYFDSSPIPASGDMSGNCVHTQITSGPGTATATCSISNAEFFQNTSGANNPMIIENDTSCSLNLTGGIVHAGSAQKFTCIIAQTWGTNTTFQFANLNINSAVALTQSGGQPVTFLTGTSPYSGAAYGLAAGNISFNQGGVAFGTTSSFAAPNTAGTTTPITTTAYQNGSGYPLFITCQFTATSSAGTCTLAISPDNVTYTTWTIATPAVSAAVCNQQAAVPPGWWYKFTFTNMTAGTIAALG